VLVKGASKRSVCRQYRIAHKTLQKILAHSEPPGYHQQTPRPQTKLGPYLAIIEEILSCDRDAEGCVYPDSRCCSLILMNQAAESIDAHDCSVTPIPVGSRLRRLECHCRCETDPLLPCGFEGEFEESSQHSAAS
jgi:hypothetical protein